MMRRDLILQELQLAPLWVRRELLCDRDDEEEIITTPAAENLAPVLGEEPDARHPLPAVARAANRAVAPLVMIKEAQQAKRSILKDEEIILNKAPDERALAIAKMDWEALQTAVRECTACELCHQRTQTVFGIGKPDATLVIVGEAPDEEDEQQGEPFVGRAGKLLDNMLASIGEKRGQASYIANVIKCRPPADRNPQATEIAQCAPFIKRQLELIAPKAILTTGRFAAYSLLENNAPISALRGKTWTWQEATLIATYHPNYLLRNLPDKSKAWDDLLLLKQTLAK